MSLFSLFQNKSSDLSPNEFREKMNSDLNYTLLDVRTSDEFTEGSIEGAKNLDFFSARFKEEVLKLSKDKNCYVYCKSGMRSGKAVKFLNENGYTAFNLKGGISAWK
ncbi:MAG: rhodanese-like domain-containing protein [Flavobacteriales bacterium]|nr:rhodanese-like domain-containing protein [Flavobacteriales bacterium]